MGSISKISIGHVLIGLALASALSCTEEKKPAAPEVAKASTAPTYDPNNGFGNGNGNGNGNGSGSGNDDTRPTEEPTSQGNMTTQCDETDCPRATVEIGVNGDYDSPRLPIVIGQPVSWSLTARVERGSSSSSSTSNSREIVIYMLEAPTSPSGFNVTNPRSENARVSWTPQQGTPSSGEVRIKTRDMTRCRALESSESDCDDFDENDRYDESISLQWTTNGNLSSDTSSLNDGNGDSLNVLAIGIGLLSKLMQLGGQGFNNNTNQNTNVNSGTFDDNCCWTDGQLQNGGGYLNGFQNGSYLIDQFGNRISCTQLSTQDCLQYSNLCRFNQQTNTCIDLNGSNPTVNGCYGQQQQTCQSMTQCRWDYQLSSCSDSSSTGGECTQYMTAARCDATSNCRWSYQLNRCALAGSTTGTCSQYTTQSRCSTSSLCRWDTQYSRCLDTSGTGSTCTQLTYQSACQGDSRCQWDFTYDRCNER